MADLDISVMNWNVNNGLGTPSCDVTSLITGRRHFYGNKDHPKGTEYLASQINTVSPDILGLEEIGIAADEVRSHDQVNALAEGTNMPHYFGEQARNSKLGFYDGNAVLSKKPFSEAPYAVRLHGPNEGRNYVHAQIQIGNQLIDIVVAHTSPFLWKKNERIAQIDAIAEKVDISRNAGHGSIILADFNFEPGKDEFTYLLMETSLDSLIDQPSYPAYHRGRKPIRKIDHILVSNHFAELESVVLTLTGSDHFPVYARLRLKEQSLQEVS